MTYSNTSFDSTTTRLPSAGEATQQVVDEVPANKQRSNPQPTNNTKTQQVVDEVPATVRNGSRFTSTNLKTTMNRATNTTTIRI